MKRIYRKYAPYLILLDATYRTTKYALPLYFLVVKTNVIYQVQWKLSKADTYGTEVFVYFREVSALERFELKSSQI